MLRLGFSDIISFPVLPYVCWPRGDGLVIMGGGRALVGPLSDLVAELAAAGCAGVGQCSGVDPPVHEIRHPLAETLATSLTHEGSLPAVNPLVIL